MAIILIAFKDIPREVRLAKNEGIGPEKKQLSNLRVSNTAKSS